MTTPSPEQTRTQALEYVRQGQEALTTMVGAVSENLTAMMRGAGTPGALPAGMPRPADAVDQAFDLTIQILEAQRAFTHSMLEAVTPAFGADAVDPVSGARTAR